MDNSYYFDPSRVKHYCLCTLSGLTTNIWNKWLLNRTILSRLVVMR